MMMIEALTETAHANGWTTAETGGALTMTRNANTITVTPTELDRAAELRVMRELLRDA